MVNLILMCFSIVFIDSILALDTSTLVVRTCDDTGMPLENVSVTLAVLATDSLGKQHIIETLNRISPPDGYIWFRQIPTGEYSLQIRRSGFEHVDSDHFQIHANEICQVILKTKPLLKEISIKHYDNVLITRLKTPSVTTGFPQEVSGSSSNTIPEHIENLPGVLVNAETGHPLFPAQRTSDLGLYIDGSPLFDPADHRPAFFPPSWFVSNAQIVRAGLLVDQDSSIGGNFELESRGTTGANFTGRFQITDILMSSTFLDSAEADEAFQYWRSVSDDPDLIDPESERLSDRRYQLLLNGHTSLVDILLTSDYRTSNRGFSSDYIADDSLIHSNTWLKIIHKPSLDSSLSLIAGYQIQEISPEKQWILRGLPPILTEKENAYVAIKLRNRVAEYYWYDVTLSGLNLTSASSPSSKDLSFRYPYGLGTWNTDNTRQSYNLIFKGGRMTRFHVVETGIRINWLDIDIVEGFLDSDIIGGEENYNWINRDSDFEFSLWGRDRWFVYENLELGIGIRWDRLNYLEESDYLSPRIYGVLYLGDHVLSGGVERVVQSPGIGFVSDETVIPIDSDLFEPVTEPQLGFRWYGSYDYSNRRRFAVKVGAMYTLLSRTVVMLPLETEPGVEVIMPISGTSGKSLGIFLDLSWKFGRSIGCTISYGYNRSRLPWGEDVRLAFVSPYPELPWNRIFFNSEIAEEIPLENEITHSFLFDVLTNIPAADIDLNLRYRVSSGLRYTAFRKDQPGDYYYDPSQINAKTSGTVHRIDICAKRQFRISDRFSVECRVDAKNILNHFQYSRANPFTSRDTVDPFRMDNNSPRTISGSLLFNF